MGKKVLVIEANTFLPKTRTLSPPFDVIITQYFEYSEGHNCYSHDFLRQEIDVDFQVRDIELSNIIKETKNYQTRNKIETQSRIYKRQIENLYILMGENFYYKNSHRIDSMIEDVSIDWD